MCVGGVVDCLDLVSCPPPPPCGGSCASGGKISPDFHSSVGGIFSPGRRSLAPTVATFCQTPTDMPGIPVGDHYPETHAASAPPQVPAPRSSALAPPARPQKLSRLTPLRLFLLMVDVPFQSGAAAAALMSIKVKPRRLAEDAAIGPERIPEWDFQSKQEI